MYEEERMKAAVMLIDIRNSLARYRTGELLILKEALNDILMEREL
jgi:hypothetical protein